MVWVDDTGLKFSGGVRCLGFGHGEGEVHAEKGHVDVLEGAHFRYVFRVAAEVDSAVAQFDDITVSESFRVVVQSSGCEVVGRDGGDFDALDLPFIPVGHGVGLWFDVGWQLLGDDVRRDQRGGFPHDVSKSAGIEMIAVRVRDENQVRGCHSAEVACAADRINVDADMVPPHGEGAVFDGVDNQVAGLRWNVVSGQRSGFFQLNHSIKGFESGCFMNFMCQTSSGVGHGSRGLP